MEPTTNTTPPTVSQAGLLIYIPCPCRCPHGCGRRKFSWVLPWNDGEGYTSHEFLQRDFNKRIREEVKRRGASQTSASGLTTHVECMEIASL